MTVKIDLGHLQQMGESLQTVAADFADANVYSDGIADACGHSGLAETVRHFAHGWDDKRVKMSEGVQALGEAAASVAESFSQLDTEFANALTSSETAQPAMR